MGSVPALPLTLTKMTFGKSPKKWGQFLHLKNELIKILSHGQFEQIKEDNVTKDTCRLKSTTQMQTIAQQLYAKI